MYVIQIIIIVQYGNINSLQFEILFHEDPESSVSDNIFLFSTDHYYCSAYLIHVACHLTLKSKSTWNLHKTQQPCTLSFVIQVIKSSISLMNRNKIIAIKDEIAELSEEFCTESQSRVLQEKMHNFAILFLDGDINPVCGTRA